MRDGTNGTLSSSDLMFSNDDDDENKQRRERVRKREGERDKINVGQMKNET